LGMPWLATSCLMVCLSAALVTFTLI
jgi:hypothetical protein